MTPGFAQPLLSHRVSFNLPRPRASESLEEIHPELLSSSQVDSGNSLLPSRIPPHHPQPKMSRALGFQGPLPEASASWGTKAFPRGDAPASA